MMNFNNVEYIASYGTAAQLPESTLPEIVFSGRSNVGKSSLINKIFNRKNLARVSSVPGKTVTINFFRCDNINFVDLPGYGYAKASKQEIERWGKSIESYFSSGRRIALVIQLIDFRHKPSKDDYQMMRYLKEHNIPFTIVFTKTDKLNKTQTEKRFEEIGAEFNEFDVDAILFSALNGTGTDDVKSKLNDIAEAYDEL